MLALWVYNGKKSTHVVLQINLIMIRLGVKDIFITQYDTCNWRPESLRFWLYSCNTI